MAGPEIPVLIRPAVPADAPLIADIYNYYIRETLVTFEEEPVSAMEMTRRIEAIESSSRNWLVAELGDRIAGYAYTGPWSSRFGYRLTSEVTVYLDHIYSGRGIGTALYHELFSLAAKNGAHSLIAGIALPNGPSVALHEKFEMTKVAHFREAGIKFGRWVDVGYWQRIL